MYCRAAWPKNENVRRAPKLLDNTASKDGSRENDQNKITVISLSAQSTEHQHFSGFMVLFAFPSQACRDFGFFYVENHGVSEEVMDEVFRQSKAFFSLGIEDKMSVKADKNNRGFTPMHEEILDPSMQVKGDTKVGVWASCASFFPSFSAL